MNVAVQLPHRYWSAEQQRWVYPGEVEKFAAQIVELACQWVDNGCAPDDAQALAEAVTFYKKATEEGQRA